MPRKSSFDSTLKALSLRCPQIELEIRGLPPESKNYKNIPFYEKCFSVITFYSVKPVIGLGDIVFLLLRNTMRRMNYDLTLNSHVGNLKVKVMT